LPRAPSGRNTKPAPASPGELQNALASSSNRFIHTTARLACKPTHSRNPLRMRCRRSEFWEALLRVDQCRSAVKFPVLLFRVSF
jgi:hypothetical protein